MAEKSDSRDSDSSWVLAGTEGLPVDTVGPEQDAASREAEEEEAEEEESAQDTATAGDGGSGAFPGQTLCPEVGDVEERLERGAEAVPTTGSPTEPSTTPSWEQEEPDVTAERGPCPDTPRAGPPAEEESCTSSDDDTEGLRRRQVPEPRAGPPPSGPALHRGTQDGSDEDGLSTSKYLLGALALAAVALLLISGGFYDPADGPVDGVVSRGVADTEQEAPVPADGSDLVQQPPPPAAADPQSVQSVSLLLDKLAKENQDIRLMQAELQAHKEELQALLQKSEGAAAAAGAQQQSLAAENEQLRAALQRETEALRAARAELQRMQEAGVPGSPQPHKTEAGEPAAEQPHGPEGAARRGDTARQEGAGHRGLLAWVRQELAAALERARGSGGLEKLPEQLSALEERLGRELEAEGARPFPGPWKKPFKADKKESRRHKRHGAGEGPHERGGWEKKEQGKPHGHGKEPRPPREHKAGKARGKSSHGPPQHGPRELPPLSHYRAPQGCAGVADCARKEGREVLGAALEPVQKAQFLQLLEGFMARLGWGGHFGGLAARLDGVFGADGAFAHDRLRFVDFVDDVEEMLEELARREGGDEEAADGFEDYVLRHYAGDGGGSTGKERGRKAWRQHGGSR
ncbi:pre-B-cell leukemia transcription factor-interacting protein 1 [Aythya fuligula]|uniref:Pre-B-cell leukemia transcription factor-interacting protein 1 n=1 Tax=Aythya fuligula TaxID=219594 RepID=A0A6J3EEQ0_AYTFU|nr:pre-B-cell leukemia transcription factor-interacting protein 1 [Aythya fuligula]